MRNKAKISLVILSAVLLSACTTKTPTGTDTQAGEQNSPQTEQSVSTSLRDLLSLGQNQKCVVSTSTTDEDNVKTDTESTIFISGKKMAQEVQVKSTDKAVPTINMRMISDGIYMYTWNTETKAQGMKIKITEPTTENTNTTNTNNGSVNLDDKVDMKCSPWLVDNSKFTIPTDVTFTDLSELMKNIPTVPAGISTGK